MKKSLVDLWGRLWPYRLKSGFLPHYLGAQIEGRVDRVAKWLVPGRLVQIHVKWADVEETPGERRWKGDRDLDLLDLRDLRDFRAANDLRDTDDLMGLQDSSGSGVERFDYDADMGLLRGYPVIVGIKGVPRWARLWKDYPGSPPAGQFVTQLGAFVRDVIRRYPQVVMVEMFNEPDVDRDDVPRWIGEFYGGWCVNGNRVNGGRLYGAMARQVYREVKRAFPRVVFGVGALSHWRVGPEFLQAAVEAGLEGDALTFHRYLRPGMPFDSLYNFAARLRNIWDRPMVVTETGYLPAEGQTMAVNDTEELRRMQRDYLLHLVGRVRSGYGNVRAILRYTLADNGWELSDIQRGETVTPEYLEYARAILP